jgi:hypothetical protein
MSCQDRVLAVLGSMTLIAAILVGVTVVWMAKREADRMQSLERDLLNRRRG